MSALRLSSVLAKLTVKDVNAGGIAKLTTVFSELPTLKSLELLDGHIGSGGAKQLGEYSSHCKCIAITDDIKKVADSVLCFLQLFCIATLQCVLSNRFYPQL